LIIGPSRRTVNEIYSGAGGVRRVFARFFSRFLTSLAIAMLGDSPASIQKHCPCAPSF
jgi:hypothetical protein